MADNIGFYDPVDGEVDWGTRTEENFTTVGENIVIVSDSTTIEAADTTVGTTLYPNTDQLAYANDTDTFYVGDGSGFVSQSVGETSDGGGSTATVTNADLVAERQSVPVPNFQKSAANPILAGADATWTSVLNMPSFFNAGAKLSSPLATYYVYYTSHSQAGLGLLTADSLDGPWTDQGRVIDDADANVGNAIEGDVIWDPDGSVGGNAGGELRRYANGPNDRVSLWTSPDGEAWTYQQTVFDTPNNHSGYPRVHRVGPNWYMGTFLKNANSDMEERVLMASDDGISNWTRIHRQAGYRENPTGGGAAETDWSGYQYLPHADFGGHLVAWQSRTALETSTINLGYTTDGIHIDNWGPQLTGDAAWEESFVKYPSMFYAEDRIGLLYSAGGNGSGSSTDIGVAYAQPGWL